MNSRGVTSEPAPLYDAARSLHSPRHAPVLGLIALCVVGFWRVLRNGYTFDDVSIVLANPSVHGLRNWPRLFTQDYWAPAHHWGLYRPLTTLSFAAEWALRPGNPALPHLVNLGLHIAVVVLLYAWIRIFVPTWAAWIGAAWFALTPLHVEVVAGVVGRSDLLATLGVLAALVLGHGATLRPRAWAWSLAAAASAGLALLAKESAITVVALLMLQSLVMLDRGRDAKRVARQPTLWMVLGISLAYIALRIRVVGLLLPPIPFLDNPLAYASSAERIRTAGMILLRSLGACLWPFQLAPDYSFAAIPVLRQTLAPVALATAAGMVVLMALLFVLRRQRLLLLGAAFFLVTDLPTSNLLFPVGTIRANRLLYLPSVGLALLVGWLAWRIRTRWNGWAVSRLSLAAVLLILGVYAMADQHEVVLWRDNQALFGMAVARSPHSAKAHFAYGLTLETGAPQAAAKQYREAIRIFPDYAAAYLQMGLLLSHTGDAAGAVPYIERAFALVPGPRTFEALAAADLNAHREGDVVRSARLLPPGLPGPAATLLAEALLRRGEPQAALDALTSALQTTPELPQPHLEAARALQALGQPVRASQELERARALARKQMAAAASAPALE